MNKVDAALLAVFRFVLITGLLAADRKSVQSNTTLSSPVLVELFTSEGCSSCPPADKLLQQLDSQPFPGTQLIVLSEHVDYWNHIGWTDPYSGAAFSKRQSAYGNSLRLDSVYTPQMVVDGKDEFVGNSSTDARKFIDLAAASEKIPVRISGATLEHNVLRAHVETGSLPGAKNRADVFVVVALNHAESDVARGENAGRRLTHVAVVRNLVKVGSVESGKVFSQEVSINLPPGTDKANLRLVAFLQEPGPGRVLGVALVKLGE